MEAALGQEFLVTDTYGRLGPFRCKVIDVTGWLIIVEFTPEACRALGYLGTGQRDQFYADSGQRAFDGDIRWRLRPVRECDWCGHDISEPGAAHPVLWMATERGEISWRCGDIMACIRRQDDIDERLGLGPLKGIWDWPVAMLEAAR